MPALVRRWTALVLGSIALVAVLACARVSWALPNGAAPGPMDGLVAETSLDRGTPRRALEGFLRAGGRGDTLEAAHYLDLRDISTATQKTKGPVLAEELWYVVTHTGRFDLLKVTDDADAPIPKGETSLVVGTIDHRDGPVPIALERLKFPDGIERWIFARSTLAFVPAIYQSLARPAWAARLPAWADEIYAGNAVWQWLGLVLLVPIAYLLARALAALLLGGAALFAKRAQTMARDPESAGLRRPLRLAAGALLYRAGSGQLALTELVGGVVGHVTFTMLVLAGAWVALGGVRALARWHRDQSPPSASDDPKEWEAQRRASRTRAALFERLGAVAVTLVAIALGLLQFEVVRGVGESLLASAGLAGVVLGFAAQRSLGAIIGGVQLSMTQPIRIGDAVFIDGEHGTIDHIYLTHVVVRRWDDRRVVLPVARFLEQPFQNLSKFGAEQTAAVSFTCDVGLPLAALRAELRRICGATALWDGRTCALDVSDFTSTTVTLRALVSAADALASDQLAREVREGLLLAVRAHEVGRTEEGAHHGAPDSGRRPSATGGP